VGKSTKSLLIALLIGILIFGGFWGYLYYYNEIYLYKTEYKEEVLKAAAEYCIDPNLIFAVIKIESSFDPDCESNKGALGLMQVMPDTAEYIIGGEVSREELLDPEININLGTKYLAYLYDRFDTLDWVLIAYNAGETRAMNWQKEGITPETVPFDETRNYVIKVTKTFNRYKELKYRY